MKKFLKNIWKSLLNAFTFIVLAVTVYFLRHDIGKTISDLGKVNAIFLLLLPFWQVLNYSGYSHMYQTLLKILKVEVSNKEMFKTAVEMNFVNHALPSGGVSGFSYFALRLREHGVSATQATFTQTMRFVLTFASFILLLFLGLFMLALGGSASNLTILITCSLAFLTLFAILIGIYIVSSKARIRHFSRGLSKFFNQVVKALKIKKHDTLNLDKVDKVFAELHDQYLLLKRNANELKAPFVYATIANVTELATIYTVYLAYGKAVNPGAVIIAYAVANFAGLIAVLPGGVGVYEGLMTAVLVSAGVPAGLAISVTVMYRVLTMAIALPPGYFLYHKALKRLDENDMAIKPRKTDRVKLEDLAHDIPKKAQNKND